MIQANELRIGNSINYYIGEDGVEYVATQVDWQDIGWCHEKNAEFNSVNKPIPITEEWLIEWGFKYDEDFDTWANENMKIWFRHGVISVVDLPYVCNSEYVHTFQNLYFVLNNTELCRK